MIGFSNKQKSILKVVMQGNDDGGFVDLDELIERVNYRTTKQSMQFSVRALIKRGYILRSTEVELRRGRLRRLMQPTVTAFDVFSESLPFVPDRDAVAMGDLIPATKKKIK